MAATAPVLLAFPDYMGGVADGLSVTPTMAGGSWQLTAPLSGLTSRFLAYRARSGGCSLAATQLVIDLQQPRAIYAVAVPRHNLTKAATYSVAVYQDAALSQLVATGSGQTGPVVFPSGSIPFEHPSWWDGSQTAENYALNPPPLLVVLGAGVVGRYVAILVADPDNPAGYVEISRPIVAPGYQPSVNVNYGATLQINDPTVVTETLGGARMFDRRAKYRTFHGEVQYLPDTEALANVFDMQLRAGLSNYGFFSYNPTDTINLARFSFPATFSQLDALTMAAFQYTGVAFSVQEVVA